MALKLNWKISRAFAVSAAALSLSACGYDGVELNGKIFDVVGLNTGSVKSADPKMKDRAPLVVPPGLESLPEPGSGQVAASDSLPITDHDAGKALTRADLEKAQAEYCAKNYDPNKALSDDTITLAKGPLGDCRPSILSAIGKMNKPDDGEEGQ
ncbi:MAG: hypothetical protein ACT4OU_12440 [Hyphomicrobium sp.]